MGKTAKKVIGAAMIILSLASLTILAYHCYSKGRSVYYMGYVELLVVYALCAACYAGAYGILCKRISPAWVKGVFALVPSTLFTAQFVFYDAFLDYLSWNNSWDNFKYGHYRSYWKCLNDTLAYSLKRLEYKYLEMFIFMFLFCILVIVIQSAVKYYEKRTELSDDSDCIEER